MATHTIENYLKAIYSLSQKQDKVSLTDISKQLEVSAATANNMMATLKKSRWIKQEKYKPIKLTAKGEAKAASIIRKHRITEMFLSEIMGIGWENVHSIAEEIEHIDSSILFERMDEMLNHPKFDPHGSPIPGKDGSLQAISGQLLSDVPPNSTVHLIGIEDSSKELLEYLNQKKIKLGSEIQVIEINRFDHSIKVKTKHSEELMLSSKVANALRVNETETI